MRRKGRGGWRSRSGQREGREMGREEGREAGGRRGGGEVRVCLLDTGTCVRPATARSCVI